jgi:hypothetical protein
MTDLVTSTATRRSTRTDEFELGTDEELAELEEYISSPSPPRKVPETVLPLTSFFRKPTHLVHFFPYSKNTDERSSSYSLY